MTKRHLSSVFAAVVASLALSISGIFGVSPVHAEDKTYPLHLLVSPAAQSLGDLEPGHIYQGKFSVRNIGSESLHYKIYAAPYYVDDQEYTSNYTNSNNYTKIAEWFKFSKTEGKLKVQEENIITYTVSVPMTVTGGAQNAAIMIESDDAVDEKQTVSASSRIALLIYSNVNGENNNCGKIIEKNIPTLLLNPPITASGLVENCGNTDLNVKYVFTVTPIFSNDPIYSNENKPAIYSTLPETRRYTSMEWEESPSIGLYKVKLEVTYNEKTEVLEKIVLICPLWVIILVIVFIGAVVFWLVSRNRERKSKKMVEE